MKTNNKHDQFQSQFYSDCLEIQPRTNLQKAFQKKLKHTVADEVCLYL